VERLSPEQEDQRRKNWVADAGSEKEKKYLEKWARQQDLTDQDRARIYAWIDNRTGKRSGTTSFGELPNGES
jgi:hypothetical protein